MVHRPGHKGQITPAMRAIIKATKGTSKAVPQAKLGKSITSIPTIEDARRRFAKINRGGKVDSFAGSTPSNMQRNQDAKPKPKPKSKSKPKSTPTVKKDEKPTVAPRVYENKAKKRVAKIRAKRAADKGYKQTGMDQVDMPKIKQVKGTPTSIAMNAQTEADIKKAMAKVSTGSPKGRSNKYISEAAISSAKSAPQKDSIIKKSTASPTASYAPKGRSNKYIAPSTTTEKGREAVRADRKLESMQKVPPLSKTQKNVSTAIKAQKVLSIPQGEKAEVPRPSIETRRTPSHRGGQGPKTTPPLTPKTGPKGNTGIVGKFEDKIGSFMSNVFGSYSAGSGVEGVNYKVKKYKDGKRVN